MKKKRGEKKGIQLKLIIGIEKVMRPMQIQGNSNSTETEPL